MNFSKKLPPMPSRNIVRLQAALQNLLNKDNSLMKIVSKPLSRQSIQSNDSENEEIVAKRQKKLSIEKAITRCRSSKNVSISKSYSSQKSVEKLPKNQISGKDIANLPYITAKSWTVYEMNSGKFLYGKKQDIRREVASLTKISNLIAILDILTENNLDPSRVLVTVTKQAASMIGTTSNIKQGMIFALKHLFYGMMLPSGNDAAFLIAQVGGTIINLSRQNQNLYKICYDKDLLANSIDRFSNNVIVFLNKMNLISKFKAKTLSTSFANPHGLSNVNSLSTAEDMAKLSAYGLKNDKFRQIVEAKNYSCSFEYHINKIQTFEADENTDPNAIEFYEQKVINTIEWQNTNKLLWRGFSGVKTGITPNAGPCLSSSIKKIINGKQHQFIIILLKSFSMDARWKETQGLAIWAQQLMAMKYTNY